MDKTAAVLIAALGAAVPIGAAHAAVSPEEAQRVLHATSVAELLDPVPNALGVMNTLTAAHKAAGEQTEVAQIYLDLGGNHHHHHHHHFYHHHHHHQVYRRYHHHHHHHHQFYNNDD